jgi:Secretion system C-terminal sorting domain
MKQFTLLVCALALTASAFAQVQVTLAVDMKYQTVGPNGVYVAGDFQVPAGMAANWTPGDAAAQLTDPDGDKIYSRTFTLPAGTYAYKFLNGNAWGTDEGVPSACAVNGNRELVVGAAAITQQNCFGTCDVSCPNTVAVDVTLQVKLDGPADPTGVHVAGAFQGWNPGATELTDADGDGIYTVTLSINNGTYGYKFVNGNSWGKDESVPCSCAAGNDRELVVPFSTTPVTMPVVCFRSCSDVCASPAFVEAVFRVDMSATALGPGGLFVAGSFQEPQWQKNITPLTDADGDDIYEATVLVKKQEHQFKYFNGDYAQSSDPNNTDFFAEPADFKALGCGCGGFRNRVFDAGQAVNGVYKLPVFVYNTCEFVSAVNDLSTAQNIKIFPNPMGQNAYLEFEGDQNAAHMVTIFDQLGRAVRQYNEFTGQQLQIQKDDLLGGVYFVQIQNEKGETATVKLVVQ